MSLVHEALRKAEREKQRKLGVSPTPVSRPTQAPAPLPAAPVTAKTPVGAPHPLAVRQSSTPTEEPKQKTDFVLPALIGCVAIVAIAAIVFLVTNASSVMRESKASVAAAEALVTPPTKPVPVTHPTPPPAASVEERPSAAAIPAEPSTPVVTPSKFTLSGIMKDPDGKSVAVLNGRVLYEGYYVDGATVKKIEPDRVILSIKDHDDLVLRLY